MDPKRSPSPRHEPIPLSHEDLLKKLTPVQDHHEKNIQQDQSTFQHTFTSSQGQYTLLGPNTQDHQPPPPALVFTPSAPQLLSHERPLPTAANPGGVHSLVTPNFQDQSFTLPTPPPSSSVASTRSTLSKLSSGSASTTLAQSLKPRYKMVLSSTEYRVGIPPVRPLPLKNSYCADDVADPSLLEELYAAVAGILTSHGVQQLAREDTPEDPWDTNDHFPICLVSRSDPRVPDSARWTLLITAIWESSSRKHWENAVSDIKPLVDSFLPGHDVDVEMIATYLTTPRRIGPVGHNPELQDIWSRISGEIEDILQENDASQDTLTVLSVFRMGLGPVEENPITVYVAVDYNCHETEWPPIIAAIRKVLDPVGLELFFEHNLWQPCTFNLVPPRSAAHSEAYACSQPYEVRPNLGADIGAAQYILHDQQQRSPSMGTLGCYVDIKTKEGQWKKMALTNYHICRPCIPGFRFYQDEDDMLKPGKPMIGSKLQKYDRGGFGPIQARHLPSMEHPSRVRHNYMINELQSIIDENDDESADYSATADEKSELISYKRFFDDNQNLLGKLWAGSGFDRRSDTNSALDWALIEVDKTRQGTNILPSVETWRANKRHHSRPSRAGMTKLKMYRDDTTLGQLGSGSKVFKYGARTGPTAGLFGGFIIRVGTHTPGAIPLKTSGSMNKKKSNEYVVERLANRPQFAEPGDSGAMVFDKAGHALGLVFSSLTPTVSDSHSKGYLTRVIAIDQIFEDIKRLTGATEVRVAEN